MFGPSPDNPTPLPGIDQLIFLKNFITRPDIEVGDFTYYDDEDDAAAFERRNVLYHYDFVGDKLIIGKFCSLAKDCTFLMNGANHTFTAFSTFPFAIFQNGWGDGDVMQLKSQSRGDTVVGNDVWIGMAATIMPGVTIGDGAIIGAHCVVAKDVAPYSIVVGNPAREVRKRFEADIVATLLKTKWWDWPIEKITRNLEAITNGDLDGMRNAV
ncbi:CatB-related O-acetyltransferase [Maritalea sp.]|jgi:virginiamycin A acetyltransferase|uniref:CatB-related O-acetyltransferase n=1 Tax=Maritalea sp. TaxID=2003361 RepID=UPI0039E2EBAE